MSEADRPLSKRTLRAMRDRWTRDLFRLVAAYQVGNWQRSDPASETIRNLQTAIAEIDGLVTCRADAWGPAHSGEDLGENRMTSHLARVKVL